MCITWPHICFTIHLLWCIAYTVIGTIQVIIGVFFLALPIFKLGSNIWVGIWVSILMFFLFYLFIFWKIICMRATTLFMNPPCYLSSNGRHIKLGSRSVPYRINAAWSGVVRLPLDITANVYAWSNCERTEIVVLCKTERCLLWWTNNYRNWLHSAWACSQRMPLVICTVYSYTSRQYSVVQLHSCWYVFPALGEVWLHLCSSVFLVLYVVIYLMSWCVSVVIANYLKHTLRDLIRWLSVHKSEQCSVLLRTTISDPTQLAHGDTSAVMSSGSCITPCHNGVVWYSMVWCGFIRARVYSQLKNRAENF